jgi:hypothetical protein
MATAFVNPAANFAAVLPTQLPPSLPTQLAPPPSSQLVSHKIRTFVRWEECDPNAIKIGEPIPKNVPVVHDSLPFFYTFPDGFSIPFDLEGPEMYSFRGYTRQKAKTGNAMVDYHRFALYPKRPNDAKMIDILEAMYRISCEKLTTHPALKYKGFERGTTMSNNFYHHPFYTPVDDKTGTRKDYGLFTTKLLNYDNQHTKYMMPTSEVVNGREVVGSKEVSWELVANSKVWCVPLLNLRHFFVGTQACVQAKIISAIITQPIQPAGEDNRQMQTIEEMRRTPEELAAITKSLTLPRGPAKEGDNFGQPLPPGSTQAATNPSSFLTGGATTQGSTSSTARPLPVVNFHQGEGQQGQPQPTNYVPAQYQAPATPTRQYGQPGTSLPEYRPQQGQQTQSGPSQYQTPPPSQQSASYTSRVPFSGFGQSEPGSALLPQGLGAVNIAPPPSTGQFASN